MHKIMYFETSLNRHVDECAEYVTDCKGKKKKEKCFKLTFSFPVRKE